MTQYRTTDSGRISQSKPYPSCYSRLTILTEVQYRVKLHLEPLAIAANITQASYTCLDHVLLTLANLFCIYTTADIEIEVRERIIGSLEKRWKKADQEVFILAVLFNPYIRGRCFNSEAISEADLYAVAKSVVQRVLQLQPDIHFFQAFSDYLRGEKEFSDRLMCLDEIKENCESDGQDVRNSSSN